MMRLYSTFALMLAALLLSNTSIAQPVETESTAEQASAETEVPVQNADDVQATETASTGVNEPITDTVSDTATEEPVQNTEAELHNLVYHCELQDHVRRVEVAYNNAPEILPCQVDYHKDTEDPGNIKTLWSASNKEGYCENQAQAFVAKLRNWGWECKKRI